MRQAAVVLLDQGCSTSDQKTDYIKTASFERFFFVIADYLLSHLETLAHGLEMSVQQYLPAQIKHSV